jgi:hypothetical protein
MNFLALFVSLPSQGGTGRMRVWRALKGLGCGTLRDGVYLLPDAPRHAQALEVVAADARAAGGTGDLHLLCGRDAEHVEALKQLFDRTGDYSALAHEVHQLLGELGALEAGAAARREQQCARRFEQLSGIDFFPGPARQQLATLMSDLRQAVARQMSPDEPQARAGAVTRRLDPAEHRRRVWATRARPRVDRLASAWLIKRHIDRRARFLWLDKPRDCPSDALGFDFDGAPFTHTGTRVTFETLLASFGLESNAALARIGALVHFLDVGGLPVAEAAGIEAVLEGARAQQADDDKLLESALQVFDWLCARYRTEAGPAQ